MDVRKANFVVCGGGSVRKHMRSFSVQSWGLDGHALLCCPALPEVGCGDAFVRFRRNARSAVAGRKCLLW